MGHDGDWGGGGGNEEVDVRGKPRRREEEMKQIGLERHLSLEILPVISYLKLIIYLNTFLMQ